MCRPLAESEPTARLWPPDLKPEQTDLGNLLLRSKLGTQCDASAGREPVGKPSPVGFKGLDQTVLLEPADRDVQGAGLKSDPGEFLDVLGEPIPVFGTPSQAGQPMSPRPSGPPG